MTKTQNSKQRRWDEDVLNICILCFGFVSDFGSMYLLGTGLGIYQIGYGL